MKAVLIVPSGTAKAIKAVLIYRGEVEVLSSESRSESRLEFRIDRFLTDWSLDNAEESITLGAGERIVVLTHVAQTFPGEEYEIEIMREELYCSGDERAVLIPEGLHLCYEDGTLLFSETDPGVRSTIVQRLLTPEQIACDGFCG